MICTTVILRPDGCVRAVKFKSSLKVIQACTWAGVVQGESSLRHIAESKGEENRRAIETLLPLTNC